MARHLLHRFLLTLPALWSVLTPVFLLIHIVPGDPVEQMLGEGAAPDKVAQLRDALGLALPFDVQYGRYLWQLAHGDFGQSFKFRAPVRRVIFLRAIPPPCGSFFSHSPAPPSPFPRRRRGQTPDRAGGGCAVRVIGDTR